MFRSRRAGGAAAERSGAQVPVVASDHPQASPAAMSPPAAAPAAEPGAGRVRSHSRLGSAWAGIWIGAVVLIALIVFILQNTRSVQVSFLGLHGTLPLAMALLIALVGGVVLALVFGTARITQLRRLGRRSRAAGPPAGAGGRRAGAGRQ
jgi:uncharacterized integral membrane protein